MNLFAQYSNAPPYVISCGYSLSLRAKTFQAARARIEGLLATAVDARVVEEGLRIAEPADGEKLEHKPTYGWRGHSSSSQRVAALVEQAGHVLGPVARAAFDRYGTPASWSTMPKAVKWEWREAPGAYDVLLANPNSGVEAQVQFAFRTRTVAGDVVGEPLPPSTITAYFAEDESRAHVSIVLPHVEKTQAFLADVEAISRALTLKIAPSRFELSEPSRKGNRKFSRI